MQDIFIGRFSLSWIFIIFIRFSKDSVTVNIKNPIQMSLDKPSFLPSLQYHNFLVLIHFHLIDPLPTSTPSPSPHRTRPSSFSLLWRSDNKGSSVSHLWNALTILLVYKRTQNSTTVMAWRSLVFSGPLSPIILHSADSPWYIMLLSSRAWNSESFRGYITKFDYKVSWLFIRMQLSLSLI